jgi:lipopolysaccharide/colanic/teichoic acid biosynthesis glycosyltransferase
VAASAVILLAPLMLAIAIAIKMSSPGPVLFRQRRIGRDLKPFQFYKFRTMRVGVDDTVLRVQIARELRGEDTSTGGSWKLAQDNRITPIGTFLRRHSLDELPQLFNVLLGQMALVGPRPCLEWEAEMFVPEFAERFAVRPGLTGLWQVSGRSTMGTREMLLLDVHYARHRTFRGDIRIITKTLPVVLRTDGAR